MKLRRHTEPVPTVTTDDEGPSPDPAEAAADKAREALAAAERKARWALDPAWPPPNGATALVRVTRWHMGYSADTYGNEGHLYVKGVYVALPAEVEFKAHEVMKIAGTLVNEARERGEL